MKSKFFILIGIILLAINLLGFFIYREVNNETPHVYDDKKQTITSDEFWEKAQLGENENEYQYVIRLSQLISERILLIDPKHTIPTIFENYLLSIYGHLKGWYEWKDTKKAVKLGGGFCSVHAIIFSNILDQQDIPNQIIGLSGHVLNTAYIDGKWRVFDPDYGIYFEESLPELEKNSEIVYQKYKNHGLDEELSRKWQKVFETSHDNWYYKGSKRYSPGEYFIEKITSILIWVFPISFLLIGFLMRKKSKS
jgi:hypothetical protein